jgi:hypothetical protein
MELILHEINELVEVHVCISIQCVVHRSQNALGDSRKFPFAAERLRYLTQESPPAGLPCHEIVETRPAGEDAMSLPSYREHHIMDYRITCRLQQPFAKPADKPPVKSPENASLAVATRYYLISSYGAPRPGRRLFHRHMLLVRERLVRLLAWPCSESDRGG